jgi:hypothetical protein
MKRNRRQLPAMVIDKKLYNAIVEKKKEIGREIEARIDIADAVQFILAEALFPEAGLGGPPRGCDWVLQNA